MPYKCFRAFKQPQSHLVSKLKNWSQTTTTPRWFCSFILKWVRCKCKKPAWYLIKNRSGTKTDDFSLSPNQCLHCCSYLDLVHNLLAHIIDLCTCTVHKSWLLSAVVRQESSQSNLTELMCHLLIDIFVTLHFLFSLSVTPSLFAPF